jgi:hypothetical protein
MNDEILPMIAPVIWDEKIHGCILVDERGFEFNDFD